MARKSALWSLAVLALCSQGSSITLKPVATTGGRIVGGKETSIEVFPYVATIKNRGSHICGASLVSSNKFVTAAHCVPTSSNLETYTVKIGASKRDTGGVEFSIKSCKRHDKYNPVSLSYDCAVCEFTGHVRDQKYFRTITLPAAKPLGNEVSVGDMLTVAGWGNTQNPSEKPDHLRAVEVPLVSHEKCQEAYKGMIDATMVCAGYEKGGMDACQGDSGGPLLNDNVLIGIVSWGYGCAQPGFPGVYCDVRHSEVKKFIEDCIKGM